MGTRIREEFLASSCKDTSLQKRKPNPSRWRCYATRCKRVHKRHLPRSRVTRIPSRQAPFLIRHIVVGIRRRRFRPPINPLRSPFFPFLAARNHSLSRRIEGERILRLRESSELEQKVTVPSDSPACKMERVSSVGRRVFDRERLEFSTPT